MVRAFGNGVTSFANVLFRVSAFDFMFTVTSELAGGCARALKNKQYKIK